MKNTAVNLLDLFSENLIFDLANQHVVRLDLQIEIFSENLCVTSAHHF